MRKKVAENDVKEPVKIRLKELKSGNTESVFAS